MKKCLAVCAVVLWAAASYAKNVVLDFTASSTSRTSLAASTQTDESVVGSWNLTLGNPEALDDLSSGDELTFTLEDAETSFTLTLTAQEKVGSVTGWRAAIGGMECASLFKSSKGWFIDIRDFDTGFVYHLQQKDGASWLATRRDPSLKPITYGEIPLPTAPPTTTTKVATQAAASADAAEGTDFRYLDVLFAFEAGAKTYIEETQSSTLETYAAQQLATMNSVLTNSQLGANMQFRFAGIVSIAAKLDTSEESFDLLKQALGSAQGDASGWEDINKAREKYGADLVSVSIDTGSAYGTVGLGYALQDIANARWYDGLCYTHAISVQAAYLHNVEIHETGHNMGAGHSNLQESTGQSSDYSFGYYFTNKLGTCYYTIMAYNTHPVTGKYCMACPMFSSPLLKYPAASVLADNGMPAGTETNNNRRVLLETYQGISQWRTYDQEAVEEDPIYDSSSSSSEGEYENGIVATFKGFDTLTDGDYTLDAGYGNLCSDGKITIYDDTISITGGRPWNGYTNGLSVLVKYASLGTPTENKALIAFKNTAASTSTDNGVGVFLRSSDKTVHGLWQGSEWTSNDSDSSKVPVCNMTPESSGYLILSYTTAGTILYDGTGTILYHATTLKTSTKGQQIGDRVFIGGLSGDTMAFSALEIEGIRIYKGALDQDDIAGAVTAFEATADLPDEPEDPETESLSQMYLNRLSGGDEVIPAKTYGAITVPGDGFKATSFDAATNLSSVATADGEIAGAYDNVIVQKAWTTTDTDISAHTLAGWFKIATLPTGSDLTTIYAARSMAATGSTSAYLGYKVAVDADGKIYVGQCDNETWRNDSGRSTISTTASQVTAGEWFHLAVSIDGRLETDTRTTAAKIFVNGSSVATTGGPFGTNLNGTKCQYIRLGTQSQTSGLGLSAAGLHIDTTAITSANLIIKAALTAPVAYEGPVEVPEKNFTYEPRVNGTPTGWISSLGSSNEPFTLAGEYRIGPTGECVSVVSTGQHPWYGLAAKTDYTVALYADLSQMATDVTGRYLVTLGGKASLGHGLVMTADGNVMLYQASSGAIQKSVSTSTAPEAGYHLLVWTRSATDGSVLYVDGVKVGTVAAVTGTQGVGFQLGSLYQGCWSGYAQGYGLAVAGVYGWDQVLSDEQVALLAESYPYVATSAAATSVPAAITGTLTLVNGDTLPSGSYGCSIAVKDGAAVDLTFAGEITGGTEVLSATALTIPDDAVITVNGTSYDYITSATSLVVTIPVARVNGVGYDTIVEAAKAAGDGGVITLIKSYGELENEIEAAAITLTKGEDDDYTNTFKRASGAALRLKEIRPKPTDTEMDVNGLESGWVDVQNTTNAWVDLADYKFIRVNRKKKTDTSVANFPSEMIGPNETYRFLTSERYANSASGAEEAVSAWAEGTFDGNPVKYGPELHNVMVWGDKVNPKKFCFVRLYYAPDGEASDDNILDTVVIPSDLPESWSVVVESVTNDIATTRWMQPRTSTGAIDTTQAKIKIGPNVGPLYEISSKKKHTSASEFDKPVPMANTNEDYQISFALNPVMHPTEIQSKKGNFRAEDAIATIRIVYRTNLDNATLGTNDVTVADAPFDKDDLGYQYTATIPKTAFAEIGPGKLIQWKFLVTDASGNEWVTPSFNNKDDGYEWYGTITEPSTEQMSAKLPTWHLFAEAGVADTSSYKDGTRTNDKTALMNLDADSTSFYTDKFPYGARVGIYDSSTSNYYDFVRIDLRGNTSKDFLKKSHGLRFAKSHPLTMVDSITGNPVEEIRKTSLISEFADPSRLRQMLAFWFFNEMKSEAPFDFPVRVNLNGKFYQLGFNSERFTDELLEDVYGWDKYGYGYKEAGPWNGARSQTEKKTPDDGYESDLTVLNNFCKTYLAASSQVAASVDGSSSTGLENDTLTQNITTWFDLPRWLNYLATTKITSECDDVWANLGAYYDGPTMLGGSRGTHTWRPAAYDMNLSFGQWYHADIGGERDGLKADQDWYKSHPFYGGFRVRCYKTEDMSTTVGTANNAVEAIWQHAKFRRLYLRRLRTIMDSQLGAPNAEETLATATAPLIVKMREILSLIEEDATLDRETWGPLDTSAAGAFEINVWGDEANQPATVAEAVEEIWSDYIVPRRVHLFERHSITNETQGIGYASSLSAGIPAKQSATSALKANFSATYDAENGVVTIANGNDEVVDMSGWTLSGAMEMTLPNGTVVDSNDCVYVVLDRRAYVEAKGSTLTDEVIVGNASAGDGSENVFLFDADGESVLTPPSEVYYNLRFSAFYGSTLPQGDGDYGEWFELKNLDTKNALDISGAHICMIKKDTKASKHDSTDHCDITFPENTVIEAGGTLRFYQKDWEEKGFKKIQNNVQDIHLWDAAGTLVQHLYVTQKTYADAYTDTSKGGYLVCTSTAHQVADDTANWTCVLPAIVVNDWPGDSVSNALTTVSNAATIVITKGVVTADLSTRTVTVDGLAYTLPLQELEDNYHYAFAVTDLGDGRTQVEVQVLMAGCLRISEICPKSATRLDDKYETGWVELVNVGDEEADTADYELARFNRGKKAEAGKAKKNLKSLKVAPGERVIVYCNEYYGSELATLKDGLYFPNKINPKKYPLVQLYQGTDASTKKLLDSVVIPVDCADGWSVIPEDAATSGVEEEEGDASDDEPTIFPGEIAWSQDVTFDAPNASVFEYSDGVTNLTRNVWNLSSNADQQTGVEISATVASQLVTTNAYTIDLWFCITNNTCARSADGYGIPIFYSRGSVAGAKNGVIVYVTHDGQLAMQPRTAAGTAYTHVLDSDTNFLDAKWHHLVFVGTQLSDGRVMVAIDGETVWNATSDGLTPLRSEDPIAFGHANNSTSWAVFQGYLADLKLYAGNNLLGSGHDRVEATETTSDYAIGYAELKGGVTRRFLSKNPTPGAENDLTGAIALGPQISSLYGKKDAPDPWQAFAQAKVGANYLVTLPVNPVDSDNDDDAIASVTLLYKADQGEIIKYEMEKGEKASLTGQLYRVEIPSGALPAAGHLIRWAAEIKDAAGNVWRAPSFNDPDGAYEWYGTIVEPTSEQVSQTLQTFHLFGAEGVVDVPGKGATTYLMNRQYDSIAASYPYGARIGVYDSVTGLYYDNVRIDLRGNTTASFTKKSHGLRFNKSQPLTCVDPVTKTEVTEVRKTSFIAEYADPTYIRQMLSMKAYADAGLLVPFDYPVRLNINGAFYQLAGHSNRFTDELITDRYGLDEFGYSYKSVGRFDANLTTSGGGCEKKTPDDGNEKELSVAKAFTATFADEVEKVTEETDFNATPTFSSNVTKTVVEKFDLAAWLNYMAMARTAQECDDVWANMCVYYDVNGTDTWMPLAYDLHLSWGAWYYNDDSSRGRVGCLAAADDFKSHPFYGGMHVRCHRQGGSTINSGNDGLEAVWQSAKFRRLYLRRLRTILDQALGEPGTPKEETPLWQYAEKLATNITAEATQDRKVWGCPTGAAIWDWAGERTLEEGMEEMWNTYFVPRRVHFYETHSVTNKTKGVGYGQNLAAGIPAAQDEIENLKAKIGYRLIAEGLVLTNGNAEAIDLSGWKIDGPYAMTIPSGTVLDEANGEVYFVTDRKAYVEAHADELTDQFIVGNLTAGTGTKVTLKTAAGEDVILIPVEPGESMEMTATKKKDAETELKNYEPVPSAEDVAAGVTSDMLVMEAVAVTNGEGVVTGYRAEVAVNPAVVPAPVLGEGISVEEEEIQPIVVIDSEGEVEVDLGVNNAKKGLWYGYEVSEKLGELDFVNDVPSFRRADGAAIKITGSKRTSAAAFFRVKVLPAKPVK